MFHEAHVAMHFQQHVVHEFLKHHDRIVFVIFNAHIHTRAAHGRKHAHAHKPRTFMHASLPHKNYPAAQTAPAF